MNLKSTAALIATVLIVGLFVTGRNVSPVHAAARCWIVDSLNRPGADFTSLAGAINSGLVNAFDRIHVRDSHVETLLINLFIPAALNNLWIIGAPSYLGPMPKIDVNGFTMAIMAKNVFIWGLNIVDTAVDPSPIALQIGPGGNGGCLVQNNLITGQSAPGSSGIYVANSPNNVIAVNAMSGWGTCILVTGPSSTGNQIKLNTLNAPYNTGIYLCAVNGPPATNMIYWNNLMAANELYDDVGNPLNYFDDAYPWGPQYGKGNWIAVSDPGGVAPYVVPPNNINQDNHPLVAHISPLRGDIDLNGVINILDAIRLGIAFGYHWCEYGWDPRADLKNDGVVDILDAITLGNNFAHHY